MTLQTTKTRVRGRGSGSGKYSARPFYATIFIFTLLAVYSTFIAAPLRSQRHHDGSTLLRRSDEDCRLVHYAEDQCDFVQRNCHDDEAGLLPYLTLYYCDLHHARPVAFVILVLWLGLLFTTIGIAASDFFSVNLSTIATILGLSESLAGVTFLAFGNGSPDVFSTFAAMGSNSGGMAVGELIGAAGFIVSVVAGSMSLVREFKVSKKTFVRDICFFIAAVSFAVIFLADGSIHLWECCVMIGFYVFYVIVVVGWHAFTKRRQARRAKEAASRSHYFNAASSRTNDELEPYRDDPDEASADPGVGARGGGPASVDIGVLEHGPRIEVGAPEEDDDAAAMHRGQHAAAEMTNNMRVSRPRGRRSNTTIMPIRPSLVGALEFRSVLSSLREESNMRMRPVHTHGRSRSEDGLHGHRGAGELAAPLGDPRAQTTLGVGDIPASARSRALSSGAVLTTADSDSSTTGPPDLRGRTPSPHTIGGKLAPPPSDPDAASISTEHSTPEGNPPRGPPRLDRLRIPSPHNSQRSSPDSSPFPSFAESPMSVFPDSSLPPRITLPSPSVESRLPFHDMERRVLPRPISWWPYEILPSPHVLFSTLFPTLQGWRNKSIWDKFLSLISVPSIFLLVITLPVVESERPDDLSDDPLDQSSVHLGVPSGTASYEPHGAIEPETEWERYRRTSRSSRSATVTSSPPLIALDVPEEDQTASGASVAIESVSSLGPQAPKPASDVGRDESTLPDEEEGWNRWLLFIQVFTGPLFTVFIVWANMAEELLRPGRTLIKMLLGSLVGSLVVLGILLMTTSPDRRPKYHYVFCFLGFCISIAWISSVAGEVVGVLKAFGVVLDISEAILGLTVFAVGNSIGDLVANVTVAKLGYPIMAL